MLLCLVLFDDAACRRFFHKRRPSGWRTAGTSSPLRKQRQDNCRGDCVPNPVLQPVEMDERLGGAPPAVAQDIDDVLSPLRIVGSYGLFAVMTTARNEIVVQGPPTVHIGATMNLSTNQAT